jgi:hypothetical protein
MGYKDFRTPLAHAGKDFDSEPDALEATIDAMFYELACEMGMADIDVAAFRDKRDEFFLVYDKFSGHARNR